MVSDLDWKDGSIPVSTRFDDPYYSTEDGRAETEYVFINGNKLPERIPSMEHCTIAELGFGTGLNFLETVRQWRTLKQETAKLHFNSFEQFPISKNEIKKALDTWPDLAVYAEKLSSLWKCYGQVLDVNFEEDIRLTVHLGDANLLLPRHPFQADAWYLDGFSPAKNPELWNDSLLREVYLHTVAGGTFSTYTAAGHVRRALRNAGFEVDKTKGFGRKRDMLKGRKPSDIHVAK